MEMVKWGSMVFKDFDTTRQENAKKYSRSSSSTPTRLTPALGHAEASMMMANS